MLAAETAAAQGARGVTRYYRIDSRTQQLVDASGIGAGKQTSQLDRSAFLRVTLADSAGGSTMRVVIDSIVERGLNLPPNIAATIDSARGQHFNATLDGLGNVTSMEYPVAGGTLATALGGQLEVFLPTRKAGFAPGDEWTTRSERPQPVAGGRLMVKRMTTYAAKAESPYNGTPATQLELTFSTSVTGTQQLGAAPARVVGTSMGNGTAFLSRTGTYLGGARTEQVERQLQIDGAPQPVLVRAESRTTITLLR
jgi:hypothetical protein